MKKQIFLLLIVFTVMEGLMSQPKLVDADSVNEYEIKYIVYGGINDSRNPTSYQENKSIHLYPPKRDGYIFDGWHYMNKKYLSQELVKPDDIDWADSNKIDSDYFSPVKGRLCLHARWLRDYDLTDFENKNMVEMIPQGNKVLIDDSWYKRKPYNVYSFKISKYEVTQELYSRIMGVDPDSDEQGFAKGKLNYVDAAMFCNELTKLILGKEECCYEIVYDEKIYDKPYEIPHVLYLVDENRCSVKIIPGKKGYRIPTIEEWEFSYRGGLNGGWDYIYSGSDDLDEVAWYYENSKVKSHKVGQKKPNKAGLYDMTGNQTEVISLRSEYIIPCGFGGSYEWSKQHFIRENGKFSDRVISGGFGLRICRSLK